MSGGVLASLRSLVAGCAVAAACSALAASPSSAATLLEALRFAPDITVSLGGNAIGPSDVAEDDFAGNVTTIDVGELPPDVHVDAYHLLPGGDQLLSFDTSVALEENGIAGPADVVRFDGAAFSIEFDAAANGVPAGVNVDALSVTPGVLLLSFDTSVRLDSTTYEDEDLVAFTIATSSFTPFFDGGDAGIPSDLDVDGAQVLLPGRLLISFDGSGRIGGVDFDDDDVLEYDVGSGNWELAYAGSSNHAGWAAGDLVAPFGIIPEPTATPTDTSGPSPTATATPMATESEGPTTPTSTPPVPATPTATSDGGTATATPTTSPTATMGACTGDCDGNEVVTIDELITIVRIALGQGLVADCIDADGNDDGAIGIDEIVAAVGRALNGC